MQHRVQLSKFDICNNNLLKHLVSDARTAAREHCMRCKRHTVTSELWGVLRNFLEKKIPRYIKGAVQRCLAYSRVIVLIFVKKKSKFYVFVIFIETSTDAKMLV